MAGGIEPAASIGGMFMPPIMGAGGFIMAELTGLPYSHIMLVALFPALMYFFSVFVMVHYEAKKENVVGERSKSSAMEIFKKQWFYIMPLVVITVFMLYGFSPAYSAILGLITCIAISWVRKDTRIGPKRFIEAAREGTENSLKIGATVGVIGIIIGVLTFSGLILTFADIMIDLAGGSLLLTILLIALASLVLGMGVPVTAAYLVTAVVAVPALTHLGVNELAAHMIVYWLSQDSNITPLSALPRLPVPPLPRPICGEPRLPHSNSLNSCIWAHFFSDMCPVFLWMAAPWTLSRRSLRLLSVRICMPGFSAEFGYLH